MGIITDTTASYINIADNNISTIMAAAKGLLCVPYLISQFRMNSFLGALAQAAVAIALSAMQTVAMIVEGIIADITGAIAGVLATITALINDLTNALALIRLFFVGLFDRSKLLYEYLKNMENCQMAGANIFSCIVKYAENMITKKIVAEYQSNVAPIVGQISNNIAAVGGVIQRNVNKEIYMAQKFQAQLTLF